MQKKALLIGNPSQTLEIAQQLWEQGYRLYAEGKTAHYLNQQMLPTNSFYETGMFQFDVVVRA